MKTTSLILLAGNSERFKSDVAKPFYLIDNRPLIYYTIASFSNELIDEIVLVCKNDDLKTVQEIVKQYSFNKVKKIVIGGNSRTMSVSNGLKEINDGVVLIHDGARPLVSKNVLKNVITNLDKYDAVIPTLKVEDSIVNLSKNYINRDELLKVQTPQGFKVDIIKNAYLEIKDATFSDDASLIQNKDKILYVDGDKRMLKVTTLEDALFINSLLKEEKNE